MSYIKEVEYKGVTYDICDEEARQRIQVVKDTASSLDKNKVDNTDFNAYKTSNDTAVKKNATDIAQNATDIAQNVTNITAVKADVFQNAIKVTTDKSTSAVINDSSNKNILGLTFYGKSTQSTEPSPDSPVTINHIENPNITLSNEESSQNLQLNYILRGVDNICDVLTINNDGTGYITQKLLYEKLTSGASYSNRNWQYSTTSDRFYRDDIRIKNKVGTPNLMCSHFIAKDNERDKTLDNTIGFTSGNAAAHGIAIRMSELNGDVSAFKSWLDNNDVYILAPLVEPVVRELSKEEVEKILNLHTYYPSTTVIADSDCQLTYIADTKNYIDNKFNELAQVMVASADESEVI